MLQSKPWEQNAWLIPCGSADENCFVHPSWPEMADQDRTRRSTFAVIREQAESTSKEGAKVIDPTEKTHPPPGSSNQIISAPPLSGFNPRAKRTACEGVLGLLLSVSCPEAPFGHR